jgi:hypothetical protein
MKTHPAIAMLQVWAFCIILFLILPFELVNRPLTAWGFFMLAAFIAAFCLGSMLKTFLQHVRHIPSSQAEGTLSSVEFKVADRILTAVASFCAVLLMVQIFQGQFLNLDEAWQIRSDRAVALMMGDVSESGLLFQISFLLYPASYVILAREVVFRSTPNLIRIGLLGVLPILLMSLVMGGRGPLLYALALLPVALRVRAQLFQKHRTPLLQRVTPRGVFFGIVFGLGCLVALNYFVNVFLVRAEGAGGVDAMFQIAESSWGVTFAGPRADLLAATIGRGNAYLVFVFGWYVVQGLVVANSVFTDYVGPPTYGISGIELLTALMRRVNGEFVNQRFTELLDLNIYGFFSSAFGSLYIDFKLFGFVLAFLWGYLATIVYCKTKQVTDPRWFLAAPFVSVGILFSFINTPLGFGNGATTHLWLVAVFLIARPKILNLTTEPMPALQS